MKGLYSHKWLQSFFNDFQVTPKEVEEKLLLHSFEVESVREQKGDTIYELDILPNRASDCLCHYGIAKELSAIFSLPLKQKYFQKEFNFTSKDDNCIQTDMCDRYSIIKIENCTLKETPDYIRQCLESVGHDLIFPIVDITNYLMLLIGQPMHAFDARKVSGKFGVRGANELEPLVLLGDREVRMKSDDIVITDRDNDTAIALAGVKGGKYSGIYEDTKDFYLEIASFNGASVRNTMRKFNEVSDAANIFSQGVSAETVGYSAHTAVELFSQFGTVSSSIDAQRTKLSKPRFTGVSLGEIERRLGKRVDEKSVRSVFERFGWKHSYRDPVPVFLEHAREQLGKPYHFGSSVLRDGTDRFDCSSLVCWCASHSGLSIPRISINQALMSTKVDKPQPGDLIFSVNDKSRSSVKTESKFESGFPVSPGKISKGVSHVSIAIGNNRQIEAIGRGVNKVVESTIDNSTVTHIGRIFDGQKRFIVEVPVERRDISYSVDLIEEIARLLGYDTIRDTVPEKTAPAVISTEFSKRLRILTALQKIGFSEIITYTFRNKGSVCVEHPVATDKGCLRENLRDGVISSLKENAYKGEILGLEQIRVMEIGNVFTKEGEKTSLAIGVTSTEGRGAVKYAEIEKQIREVLSLPGGFDEGVWEVDLDDVSIPKQSDEMVFIERPKNSVYVHPSKFPFVLRDVSAFAPEGKSLAMFQKDISEAQLSHLVRINVLDEFVKDGKTSYAVRMVFQSHDETLTDDTVNAEMEKLYTHLKECGYTPR